MNLFLNARLTDGETVLLHGGGGGVTTAAMQIVKALAPRARIIVTASPGKLERVAQLGADVVIDYKTEDFADAVLRHTDKRGADVILDHIGGAYLAQNQKALAVGGRLALIGVMGGRKAELDLGRVLMQRQSILGSVLRPRTVEQKSEIIRAVRARRPAALRERRDRAADPRGLSARARGRCAPRDGGEQPLRQARAAVPDEARALERPRRAIRTRRSR